MKQLLIFITLFLTQITFAQEEEVKNYKWDENPKFKEIPAEFNSYPAVVLKDYRLYENKVGGYAYKAFIVKHQAIKILSEAGINEYNKVSINNRYVRDYKDLKVRVIKPDGKIEELPKEKILEKEGTKEKQFVFEGVEKGDIIEYYYVIKDYPEFSGSEYFQRDIPVLEAKFQINKIAQAQTYTAAYNGMINQSKDKITIYTASNLPAYKFERNATNLANLAKVYYFLNTSKGYDYISYYNSLNSFADGVSAKSMIKDFIEKFKLNDPGLTTDEKIKIIDIYLKENIEIDKQYVYKKALETKKMMPTMVLYFYKDVLDYLKIKYQFAASTDKFDDKFDKENVVPDALSEILIYIPETKKYLSPFQFWMPYGQPNALSVNNDAVYFNKEDREQVTYEFKKIENVLMDDNVTKATSNITIDDDMETVLVDKKSTYTGYLASYFRYALKRVAQDKINDFVKNNTFNDIDVEVQKYSFENQEYKNNYDPEKPFTINSGIKVKESWIENAGKNNLITIGKVLGKQTSLHQETTRTNPIVISYPKKNINYINLSIPSGYSIKNVANLAFNKEIKNANNDIIGSFKSTAQIEGNTVKIAVEEFYNFTYLEKEKYNEYRDMIDAIYDFNNASLILTRNN
ncbi:protein of unknown function [Flavobacterium aquidurense]|uniref:DUF3857 domain-containing protein n=1 Tax=Flavobacterium frigidimaris TaxID=262320 RepID=A0ABX4BSE4_FLAFR|nr:DUF3857 domain-containing protein [Flavobacterium frigidimaris]OXA80012.1 hypothetical protein B0A65_08725 [Flavobacterium frigidimaris]SDZ41776.1 protein of unknown function [Flavobacterium aquidurense]